MSTDMQNVQTAVATIQTAKRYEIMLGLDVPCKPPMCHVYANAIVAFFLPPLGHYLARPGDVTSKSFLGVSVIWLASCVISFIPILGSILWFITFPAWILVTIYAIFVVFLAEKRNPRDPAPTANATPGSIV